MFHRSRHRLRSRPAAIALLALFATDGTAQSDIVRAWNLAITSVLAVPGDSRSDEDVARVCALAHGAMWNAMREVQSVTPAACVDDALTAAASRAAHDVLVALAPEHASRWDAQHRADFSTWGETPDIVRGARCGAAAAARVLRDAGAGNDAPLLLRSATQFSAAPPFRLRASGSTPAFRNRREFHDRIAPLRAAMLLRNEPVRERPVVFWNRVARRGAEGAARDDLARARLFAALNAALADAALAATEAQRQFACPHQVPASAISHQYRALPSQGPGGAVRWDEMVATTITIPAVPKYPSRTAAMAGAAATVLRALLPDGAMCIIPPDAQGSTGADGASDLAAAAHDAALAQAIAGRECIEAAIAGYDQGAAIGRFIARQPRFRVGR